LGRGVGEPADDGTGDPADADSQAECDSAGGADADPGSEVAPGLLPVQAGREDVTCPSASIVIPMALCSTTSMTTPTEVVGIFSDHEVVSAWSARCWPADRRMAEQRHGC